MKLSERIRENENYMVEETLRDLGYTNFWNEYCPQSRFFTKDIEDNKTLYVRKDVDTYRNNYVYSYEAWIRDNNKNILDKNVDSNHNKCFYKNSVDDFIEYIKIDMQ